MSKILLILTKKYPYGMGESFIESERKSWEIFDQTIICPVLVNADDKIRPGFCCNNNERLVTSVEVKHPGLFDYFIGLFGFYSFFKIIKELFISVKTGNKPLYKFKVAYGTAIRTNLRIKRIRNELNSILGNNTESKVLLYSYWMYEPVLVGVGLKCFIHVNRFITRAHGYDLYEERHPNLYIPFRNKVFDSVDSIYTISLHGKNYLNQKYNYALQEKIEVSRLGIIKLFNEECNIKTNDTIVIVSCSYMKPLKRLHLIIEALSKMSDKVHWIHFGDGSTREEIERKAKELPDNISYSFMGLVTNEDIQHFYSTHYIDAFINVSEAEGVPVSIMESQAYGIPAVATNVGGTSEIVHDHVNGILLSKDFAIEELINGIYELIRNASNYRAQSKHLWNQLSNATDNYSKMFNIEYIKL